MADETQGAGGARIDRMSVRIPGESRETGSRLASQLERALAAESFTSTRHLAQVDLQVRVPSNAGPELVAQAIVRALRRRIG